MTSKLGEMKAISSMDEPSGIIYGIYECMCFILAAKTRFSGKSPLFSPRSVVRTVKASGSGWTGLPERTGSRPGIRGTIRNANIVRTYYFTQCTYAVRTFLAKIAGHRVYKSGTTHCLYVSILKVVLPGVGNNLWKSLIIVCTHIVTYEHRQVHIFGVRSGTFHCHQRLLRTWYINITIAPET